MITHKEFSDEKELLEACVRQDRQAQRLLYEIYSPKMFAVCMRYAGERERARDILQDGFITVFEKIGSFSGNGSFEGWLRRVFVNTALMSLRKGDVLRFSEEICDTAKEFAASSDVLEGIGSRELMRLVSSMPSGFRTVFNMYVLEGFSHNEIALKLGISEGSSRSQLSRARQWLQEKLTNKNY
jgi:RNA polymerase sigma-70 factor (ECF subfamily)